MSVFKKIHTGRFLSLGSIRQWHWISSAVCLIGMLLFSITGITLNHASQIKTSPKVTSLTATLSVEQLQAFSSAGGKEIKAPLPPELIAWLAQQNMPIGDQLAEWREDEIYVALPRPGGDGWLSIDRESGEVLYEITNRGWISYFNDLHKARNTGQAWTWFVDVFAVACIIFCITGFILLQRYAGSRPFTWPMVALGLVLPWILILLFIH